jgi:3-oxoadipate enol-lactonase
MGEHVRAGDLDIWTEQVGEGPDVLLIGGGGDTVESWQFQLDGLSDRYRLTAFDNRGAGRTAMPGGSVSVEVMADDAAGVLRALDIRSAHVAGFSGGSIVSQELALRHPELVRSLVLQSTWPVMDAYLRSWLLFVRWLVEVAPSERAFLEGFFLWIYTPRAHNDGTVDQIIEEVLAFPHKQTAEDLQAFLDAFLDHDTSDRLPEIAAPTLVLAGGRDMTSRPPLCRAVAELIPGARFEVMRRRPIRPSRRSRTSGMPASTPSGARRRREAEVAAAQRMRSGSLQFATPGRTCAERRTRCYVTPLSADTSGATVKHSRGSACRRMRASRGRVHTRPLGTSSSRVRRSCWAPAPSWRSGGRRVPGRGAVVVGQRALSAVRWEEDPHDRLGRSGLRGAAALAGDDAGLPRRPATAEQGGALSRRPANRRGDRVRHAPGRRGAPRLGGYAA